MVCYCCVKGCNNNSNNKKKDPDAVISFHAFPSNKEVKSKWLKAIGRPDWEPPSHSRICSAHFSFDQINHDGCRTRIKDDAYPINALPPNSNFEASQLEVCRICLDTNLKMYSLRNGLLKTCMETIAGFNEKYNIEGLPQFVCYLCAAHLLRCYNFIEKSMIAQAALLDIFAQNGQITKNLVKNQNRKELNLTSTLSCFIDKNIIEFKYNDESIKSSGSIEQSLKKDFEIDIDYKIDGKDFRIVSEPIIKLVKFEDGMKDFNDRSNSRSDDNGVESDASPTHSINSEEDEQPLDIFLKENPLKNQQEIESKNLKKMKKKSVEGLTPDETKMQKYFNIVKLSFEQQIEEWKKSSRKCVEKSSKVYECDICHKLFAHLSTFQTHIASHDPSRGEAVCPVCKLRFKNKVLAKSHANRAHGKKFHCKTCPKSFNNVGVAKKHHLAHCGHEYRCSVCAFRSRHESSLGAHVRRAHVAPHVCARCGRACRSTRGLVLHAHTAHGGHQETEGSKEYRCEQCNINFTSEGAKRVHLLTSSQHRRKADLCDATQIDQSLKNSCSKCGEEFQTARELVEHTRAQHPRSGKKTSWRLPGDSYPTQCEHCDEVVNNRREHWWHVRRQHPNERGSYRPVITAVCDTCGKGFQNSTKLHLHELRHAAPSVRCPQCPRTFYDKYALTRHLAVHCGRRPHRCAVCGRGFGLRGNLDRHSRVHTGVTPYECSLCAKKFKYSTSMNLHIRTVHYKLPHPPRKKKSQVARSTSAQENCDI